MLQASARNEAKAKNAADWSRKFDLTSYCSYRLKKAIKRSNTFENEKFKAAKAMADFGTSLVWYEPTYTYDKDGNPANLIEVSLVEPKCSHDWQMIYPDSDSFDWYFKCKHCGKTKDR